MGTGADRLARGRVVSANPGSGGRASIPVAVEKVRQVRAQPAGRPADIEVAGGVAPEPVGATAAAGANAFVAGRRDGPDGLRRDTTVDLDIDGTSGG
ncbi:hypothetical protein CEE80_12900 [Lactobacillus crispatus]|uniref:hypothetical protein n=1 Tax=Lactobacillus crispatus TaxID=47770 RepID=UPI0010E08EE3|nr:hypothetical protein CEE80_12900 [Lactobacillus crispatus]